MVIMNGKLNLIRRFSALDGWIGRYDGIYSRIHWNVVNLSVSENVRIGIKVDSSKARDSPDKAQFWGVRANACEVRHAFGSVAGEHIVSFEEDSIA